MNTQSWPIRTVLAATMTLAGLCAPGVQSAANDGGSAHRVIVERDAGVDVTGLDLLEDYGSFRLYRASSAQANRIAGDGVRTLKRADFLEFSAGPIDTRIGVVDVPAPFTNAASADAGLHIVQFIGPIRGAWLQQLADVGIVPVQYVANHGYLVWVEDNAVATLAGLADRESWLSFTAPLHAHLKIDPLLQAHLNLDPASEDEIDVTVQIHDHTRKTATRSFVESLARVPVSRLGPIGPGSAEPVWHRLLSFENLTLRVRLMDVPAIARRPDVTFVGLALPMRLMDERQAILMTGDFAPSAASIDYLQFLHDLGFSDDALDYPIVDITDTPVHEGGTGVTVLDTADAKLRVAGVGASRVISFVNCSSTQPDTAVGDIPGHGSINAGIVAGFDQRSGWPYQDNAGHQLGLGINPFVRIGSTAIFTPGYDLNGCGGNHAGLIRSNWHSGARISNNAWGSSQPPATYEASQQTYDAGVRDADPTEAFNQQMIYVFSAGNLGSGMNTMSAPAAAKNVITVGASENVRPDWLDGCGAGPDMADNANDVATFSSRGPAPGGRTKPETIAPGTHVQGGASNFSGYNGTGVCDTYYPPGQTEFASSSGTSHSAPAVAGLASLAWWWIEQGGAGAATGSVDRIERVDAPSPALIKAWLMAHPLYLDGVASGDDLPSNAQGYGMPDIAIMFDDTPKVVIDQSHLFVESGETALYRWAIADPTRPLRVALAYTDAPGALGTSPQVNDLDLKVSINGQTWFGNQFDGAWSTAGGEPDPLNNYEAVFLPPGAGDDVIITIVASNIGADAVNANSGPSQDFALVCYNCVRTPGFAVDTERNDLHVCAAGTSSTELSVAPIAGFSDDVTLSASSDLPDFAAQFLPNPVATGNTAQFLYSAPAASATGVYELTVTGTADEISRSRDFSLQVYDVEPDAVGLTAPSDGAVAVELRPNFTWTAQPQALAYLVQIAEDPDFARVVIEVETAATNWTPASHQALDSSRPYWWRVVARNPCGDGAPLPPPADTLFRHGFEAAPTFDDAHSFSTQSLPLDCALDIEPVVLFDDDLEGAIDGWSTGAGAGSENLWQVGGTAHSGSRAWQMTAPDSGSGNEQWLVSPEIFLPADLDHLRAQFWQQNAFKSGSNNCQDGGIVEISTNQGSSWTQVLAGVHGQPYDGVISGSFQNPLGGRPGWCGDPRTYTRTILDLSGYAGQSVRLRFRAGHDRFVHRRGVNWAIDDVLVRGCSVR